MTTATLEKQKVKEPQTQDEAPLDSFHWTVDAFYKAFDAGALGQDKRLELIHGRIIKKMPPGPHHCYLADAIAAMLRAALEPPLLVREEKSIRIAFDGEPIPDITVVRGAREDYRDKYPTPAETALVVEVSDSTADYDLGEKALRYAQAGIKEYWVVLVKEDSIVVHRKPSQEGYEEVSRLSGGNTLSALILPEAVWTINALLGKED